MSRRTTRSRCGADAQAIIVTAIVIPVLLALVAVFLAVMVQVEALATPGFVQDRYLGSALAQDVLWPNP
jgi:hypothetical protein